MTNILGHVRDTVWENKGRWIGIVIGFLVLYYASLLSVMLIRFGEVPNYVTFYNWPANVWTILTSTPSFLDAIGIARDEWLIEVGFMNYDYGHGIAEWTVTVWPTKLALLCLAGALVATLMVLLFSSSGKACKAATRGGALAATGAGAFLVGLASATLSWVVCCATPTWVVSLVLLGMSPGLVLWLEPLGGWMILAGYTLLVGAILFVARRETANAVDGTAYGTPVGQHGL